MANSYGYITFYRGRSKFLRVLIGFVLTGAFSLGALSGVAQSVSVIAICILFFCVFMYEVYLSSLPIVEIISDSMTIRQIYDPIFRWRFIYTTHIIGFTSIVLLEVKLNKRDRPEILSIQYTHGTQIKRCYLTKNDVVGFENVIKLIEDKLPSLAVNYIK